MTSVFRNASVPTFRIGRRTAILVVWLSLVGAILGIKALSMGWFAPQQPLELNGQPALLFFNLTRGCECQRVVARNAEAQVAAWPEISRAGIPIHAYALERRRDLARQYQVIRAPALLLVDGTGDVVWRQDGAISSDLYPFEINQFEAQIGILAGER
jgi:hypothetical protein